MSPPLSRRFTHGVAVALAALTCGIGAAGCGSGPSKEEQAAERRAQARWETGVPRWRTEMLHALNELSLMLADAQTVERLQRGHSGTLAQIDRFEDRLEGCSQAIRRLGAAPGVLEPVREEALATCRSLERGARLVRDGIVDWQEGRGNSLLNDANVALGSGQRGLDRTRRQLRRALDG
jgi:hypothetical protein